MQWFTLTLWGIVFLFFQVDTSGQCDSVAVVTEFSLTACPGDSVLFNGVYITADETDTFFYTTPEGCDSLVLVSVNTIPADTTHLIITTCPEDEVSYNGYSLAVGDSAWVTLTSSQGCDSLVIVQVEAVHLDTGLVTLAACAGDSVFFSGYTILAGDTQLVSINFSDGCDSIILVSVAIIPADTTYVELATCPTGILDYHGYTLGAGDELVVNLQNQYGCDSLVFVSVLEIQVDTTVVQLAACPGTFAVFAGEEIPAGDSQYISINYANGCDSVFLVTVAVLPTDTIFAEVEICKDETIDFQGITLSPGDQATAIFTNQWGCDSVIIFSVTASPDIIFSTATDATCPETAEGIITITNIEGEGPFLCALDNDPFQPITVFPNLKSGLYKVRVMDTQGCEEQQETSVAEKNRLEVEAQDYQLPCGNSSVTLRPVVRSFAGEVHWQWSDGSENAWALAQAPGTFHVSVSDDCMEQALSLEVTWDDERPADPFYLPNAFSPNGDGINDQLQVYLSDGASFQSFELNVFDRWGALLFQTFDPGQSWDGQYQLDFLNPGVYAYFLKAEVEVCGRREHIFREGDITLMR